MLKRRLFPAEKGKATEKKTMNPAGKGKDAENQYQILERWTETEEGGGNKLKYLCYRLRILDPGTGESMTFFKVIRFIRVIRIPKAAKQSTSLMDMQRQILSGAWEGRFNMVTVIANMICPVPAGLLFLYGVQCTDEDIREAKRKADLDFHGLVGMLGGTYRVLHMESLDQDHAQWLIDKLFHMKSMAAIRGIPKARNSGEDAGNKGIGGGNLNPDSEGTIEEFISAMADFEYVIQILSTPVYPETILSWLYANEDEMTYWQGQMQGTKSVSFSVGLPMMIAQNVGQSQGRSVGYNATRSRSYSTGESYTTGYSQNTGKSLTKTLGESFGLSSGQSHTQSSGKSYSIGNTQTKGQTKGFTEGYTQGETDGVTEGITKGRTIGQSQGYTQGRTSTATQGIAHGSSSNYSIGNSRGNSLGTSIGQSQGITLGKSQTQSQSLTRGMGLSQGESMTKGLSSSATKSHGTSEGSTYSQGHSDSSNTSHSVSNSHSISNSQSNNYSLGSGASVSQSASQSKSNSLGVSKSASGSQTYSGSSSSQHSDSSGFAQQSGQSQGINGRAGVGGFGIGVSTSQNGGDTNSQSSMNGTSNSFSSGGGYTQGGSASAGASSSVSQSNGTGRSASVSVGGGVSTSEGFGTGESYSLGHGSSYNQTYGASYGENNSISIGNSASENHGTTIGQTQNYSEGSGTSAGATYGVSAAQNMSQNAGSSSAINIAISGGSSTSRSNSVSNSMSVSQSASVSQSDSLSRSLSQSHGVSYSQSLSQSLSNSDSVSESETNGVSEGTTIGQTQGQSYTASSSDSEGESYGESNSVSNGRSTSEGTSLSDGLSSGLTNTYTRGASGSMGFTASLGYNHAYQWKDQGVADLVEILEYQNERLKKALRGEGMMYVSCYISCPDEGALATAKSAAKSTWQNEGALRDPVHVIDLERDAESSLHYRATGFSTDITLEDIAGIKRYKYQTPLLPEETASYTHPPRISEGGVDANIGDVPKFRVPANRKGDIYMGTVLNAERYTFKNGYRTPYQYRIDSDEIMHGCFTGQSRSGKTVAAMRFVRELSQKRRKDTGKRFRIVIMDQKQDWRGLASFIEPERFRFYNMGDKYFRPIDFNPCKVPLGVNPQLWVDTLVSDFCRSYGLLERGKQLLSECFFKLYEEAGVFDVHFNDPDGPERVTDLSRQVTFAKAFDYMEKKKASLEDPANRSGRAGNDTRDAYARILERLSCFSRPYSIERSLFSHTDRDDEPVRRGGSHPVGIGTGLGVDELIGEDEVTVFEAHGLEPTFSCFIFSVLTSGFYLYGKALEGGFRNPDQYETVLVIEEANKVLTGNDTAGSASKGIGQASLAGESIFEEILDQAAGYGLFVIAITQKISMMPSSVIANCGLLFVGRLGSPQDVDLAIRMMGREGRYEDRDIVKFLPASPVGWFICRSNRIMNYCDADPVLVQIEALRKTSLTNKQLDDLIEKGEMRRRKI